MADRVDRLVENMRALQDELEDEFERRREEFHYRIERGRVIFEQDVLRRQRELRQRLGSYIAGARLLVVLTAPVIYAVIIPFVLLDLFVTLYQAICFPVYGIEKVKRADYITFDRGQLPYLNGLEKLNCMYCSYGNGLLAYAREIAGRTEKHWCPIKHAKRMAGMHDLYPEFVEYGDGEGFQRTKRRAPDARQ
ncbi:hypothetical protein [Primorskyibacter sedentarius]|uniref:Uncharacterized protein n=1 Tax=Primorskyibacter sedentarius TaxID=745311 RepID=A0A4R3JLC4_9RHOB|nr:hypothetical protein [Primorskyibacter sedentarius]TCS67103.1 hypothetical protein EDD52_101194 [Primorskyibacter sedentarius]